MCSAADSGLFKITWTLKNGGWPRYIATNLAGMYRNVFGIKKVKGLKYNDFKFIPHKPLPKSQAAAAAAEGSQPHDVAAAAETTAADAKPALEMRHSFNLM